MNLEPRVGRFAIVLLLAFPFHCAVPGWARAVDGIPSQRELNGFLLGQKVEVLNNTLGKPDQLTTTDDGWVYRVYRLKATQDTYMAFKSNPTDKDLIYSIQIEGGKGSSMQPFVGLVLGDPKQKVLDLLGKPSKIDHDSKLKLDLLSYDPYNYSVEIDSSGSLSSIQIFGYAGFPDKPENMVARLDPLQDAVKSADVDKLMQVLCPDVEIYKSKETTGFVHSARKDLSNPQSSIYRSLCGQTGSLRAVFDGEHAEGRPEMRLYEKAAPGCVYKFKNSKIVEEIVYKYESGQWRVYEIQFR